MFATVSVTTRVMIICCCQLDGTLNHPEDNPLGMSVRVFTQCLTVKGRCTLMRATQSTGLGPCPSKEENSCIHVSAS